MKAKTTIHQPRRLTKLPFGTVANGLFILLVLGSWTASFHYSSLNTLSLIWCSILLEALPFMLLGSIIGGLIETFVSYDRMMAILPKRQWQTILLAAGLGIIFPVCECAIVPVVRRLARKGFPVGAVIAYLLGGPIVNPVVGASTLLAYAGDWTIAALRLGLGYLLAVTVGFLISSFFNPKQTFVKDVVAARPTKAAGASHHHHHHGCTCSHHAVHPVSGWRVKLTGILSHASEDFISAGRYLIIGAFIAALANTYIGREGFTNLASMPGASILLMMVLAVGLNLCSEADAFVAASFRQLVPLSAQMAFMLLGPMLDIKLLLMYRTLFKPRVIMSLSLALMIGVLVVALLFHWGGHDVW